MKMDKLYTLVKTVTDFPELYIGKPSLERLYAYIGGFLTGNPEGDDHCMDGFNEYVAEKYRLYSDHNWAQIIQFFSPSEEYAFKEFISLFDEFTQQKARNIPSSKAGK